ncbi:helix-turn-helix domain-containing protein [Devosia salina]|uniref:Transcriptional regulator n=1 Tax=Devosia salina TaxID=2860336 RepID=A0ABX8WIA0_9HYPH|nr:transcriptional regulator [Devosia salina]QYO77222.1 transcriptional regulator [Devosia salina]
MRKGAVSWNDIRAELPQDMQDRLDDKRTRRLAGEAMAALRKEAGVTQSELAAGAEIPQSNVSRTEKSDDMLLSTIARYMRAIGGSAELVLRTAQGKEVHIGIDAFNADNARKRA